MARKTIEYVWPMGTTDVAEGTAYTDTSNITVWAPEVTGRTWVNAVLELSCHDNHGSPGADISAVGLRLSCDGGSTWTSVVFTAVVLDTGENIAQTWTADVTAELTARFGAGASNATVRAGWYIDYSATGPVMNNVTIKLRATYDYTTGQAGQRVKTVKIPIESLATKLAADVWTTLDTLPALNQYLPEGGVVVRQAWIELYGQTLPPSTTNFSLDLRFAGGSAVPSGVINNAATTGLPLRWFWDVTALVGAGTILVEARVSAAGVSAVSNLCGFLCVTYTFDPALTAFVLHSVEWPFEAPSNAGQTSSPGLLGAPVILPELGPYQQRRTGLQVNTLPTNGGSTFSVKVGGQAAFRAISENFSTSGKQISAGALPVIVRADSGAANGLGWTLTPGRQLLTAQLGASSSYNPVLRAVALLSWVAPLSASGIDCHTRQISRSLGAINYTGGAVTHSAVAAWGGTSDHPAPLAVGIDFWVVSANFAPPSVVPFALSSDSLGLAGRPVERGGGIGGIYVTYPNEIGAALYGLGLSSLFIGPRALLSWFSSRSSMTSMQPAQATGVIAGITWQAVIHNHPHAASGAVKGYQGTGSGIEVTVCRRDTGELVGKTTTGAAGVWSIPYPDTTADLIAVANDNGEYLGAAVIKAQ